MNIFEIKFDYFDQFLKYLSNNSRQKCYHVWPINQRNLSIKKNVRSNIFGIDYNENNYNPIEFKNTLLHLLSTRI